MQLKYSNYVAFSHFHGKAVNNSGLLILKDLKVKFQKHYLNQTAKLKLVIFRY